MTKFEKEILDEVSKAEEKIKAIIERIDVNAHTDQNKDGILKQGKGSYADCIKIDMNRMQELLTLDSNSWVEELAQIKLRIQQSRE